MNNAKTIILSKQVLNKDYKEIRKTTYYIMSTTTFLFCVVDIDTFLNYSKK